ncbi:MAG: exosortase/archaeosortase family protein [Candidatus Zixiibacteriota bacterium]
MNSTASQNNISARIFIWISFAVLALLYMPVLIGLIEVWWADDNYSHGFLIPLISGYLLWKKRKALAEVPESKGNNPGLLILIFGMLIFVLATAAAEYFTMRASMVITLFGLVWYIFGYRMIRITWFELLFLFFMIPLPYVIYYALTFPMQLYATTITTKILSFVGMSAVQQGNVIHLPGYSLEVAEACSGLRSLISLLALGALYARFTQKTFGRQVFLFLSTIPIAIAANIFRLLFTSVGAYAVSRELAEDFLHELSGMMVFVVAFIMLFIWGAIIKPRKTKA